MKARHVALLVVLSFCSLAARAQYAPPDRPEWNHPVEPFRIVGNIYYVGAANVSSFLITTDEGHFLIETGFRETAPLIETSIAKLGFDISDVRILLTSHAHYDHAGALADLKTRTGARFLSIAEEEAAFARGGKDDFAFGDKYAFPPIHPDALVQDGEEIRLGGVSVTVHLTPGHTKGCMSFTTDVTEGNRSYHVVFPCSLSAPGYQLANNPRYPEIVQDYERTIAKLRALPCDIFFPHHRSAFRMLEVSKTRTGDGDTNPFVDPAGYKDYLDEAQSSIREQLEAQTSTSGE